MWPFRRKPNPYLQNYIETFWGIKSREGSLAWAQWIEASRDRWEYSSFFADLSPHAILQQKLKNAGDIEILCHRTAHCSGFIREAAIQRLDQAPRELALPLLLRRLNDWVPQVRQAAKTQLLKLWPNALARPSPLLWELLPIFEIIFQGKRGDHQEFFSMLLDVLAQDDAKPLLLASNNILGTSTSRWAITALFDFGFFPKDLSPWLNHKDPVLRLRLIRKGWKCIPPSQQRQTLENMSKTKEPFLRKESLHLWSRHFPEQAQETLLQALEAKSGSVRGCARFYLKKQGFDIHTYLRGRAVQTLNPKTWVAFAEIGKPEDRPLFEGHLCSKIPRLRLAAYIYSLNQKDPHQRILDGICNPIPQVAKSLQRICIARKHELPIPALINCLHSSLPPSYRKPLLKLLEQSSTLHALAELLHPPSPQGISDWEFLFLQSLLFRLDTKASLRPNPKLRERIQEGLLRHKESLPENIQASLGAHLQFWGKS